MKTPVWAMCLVLFTTTINAFAQVLYKKGANIATLDFYALVTNYYLIVGAFLYFISAVLLVIALKYGELSVLYPIISTGFIWVSFLSVYFFSEFMNFERWLGIVLIIIGISFIGIGSNRREK